MNISFSSTCLSFLLAPPTVQQKMQDFEVSRGQEVTITVTADGSPLPTCTWFHNDKPLQVEPDRVVIVDDGPKHTLTLLSAELTDDGQYKVKDDRNFSLDFDFLLSFKAVIENQMGKTELLSQVTVMGKSLCSMDNNTDCMNPSQMFLFFRRNRLIFVSIWVDSVHANVKHQANHYRN